ncbi:MAG: pyridoxamine 5'-phosphate oxidase family protein, partial [Fibrobacter sp.]|nr:pyridoxamine 5'-phosphate oxidase family protein [Fibrobacter sp.]
SQLMNIITAILADNRTAVLATVDSQGKPHIRWVTPGCIVERPGTIFMVSASRFSKVEQIRNNPHGELMVQTRALDKIVTISGTINLLSNPSIRLETLECIGPHLSSFWISNQPESELVVLEFIIESATLYIPQKGSREEITFATED